MDFNDEPYLLLQERSGIDARIKCLQFSAALQLWELEGLEGAYSAFSRMVLYVLVQAAYDEQQTAAHDEPQTAAPNMAIAGCLWQLHTVPPSLWRQAGHGHACHVLIR